MGALSVASPVATITLDETQYRQALRRVRSEFLEMPGMILTAHQVQRLAGVDAYLCACVLEELVLSGLLCRGASGTYKRS